MCLKHSAASHLGLHSLARPVCPNTYGTCSLRLFFSLLLNTLKSTNHNCSRRHFQILFLFIFHRKQVLTYGVWQRILIECQDLFSKKNEKKKKCCLLQILLGPLRVIFMFQVFNTITKLVQWNYKIGSLLTTAGNQFCKNSNSVTQLTTGT